MNFKQLRKDFESLVTDQSIPIFAFDAYDLIKYSLPLGATVHNQFPSTDVDMRVLDHHTCMSYLFESCRFNPVTFSYYVHEFNSYYTSLGDDVKGLVFKNKNFIDSIQEEYARFSKKKAFFNRYLPLLLMLIQEGTEINRKSKVESIFDQYVTIDRIEANLKSNLGKDDAHQLSKRILDVNVDLTLRNTLHSKLQAHPKFKSWISKMSPSKAEKYIKSSLLDVHVYCLILSLNSSFLSAFNAGAIEHTYQLVLVSSASKFVLIEEIFESSNSTEQLSDCSKSCTPEHAYILQSLLNSNSFDASHNSHTKVAILDGLKATSKTISRHSGSAGSKLLNDFKKSIKSLYINKLNQILMAQPSRIELISDEIKTLSELNSAAFNNIFTELVSNLREINVPKTLASLTRSIDSISEVVNITSQHDATYLNTFYSMPFGEDGVISQFQRVPLLLFTSPVSIEAFPKSVKVLVLDLVMRGRAELDIFSIINNLDPNFQAYEIQLLSHFASLISISQQPMYLRKSGYLDSLLSAIKSTITASHYKGWLDNLLAKSSFDNRLTLHEEFLYLYTWVLRMSNDISNVRYGITLISDFMERSNNYDSLLLQHSYSLMLYTYSRFASGSVKISRITRSLNHVEDLLFRLLPKGNLNLDSSIVKCLKIGLLNSFIYRNCKLALLKSHYLDSKFDRGHNLSLRVYLKQLKDLVKDLSGIHKTSVSYDNYISISHTETYLEYCEAKYFIHKSSYSSATDVLNFAIARNISLQEKLASSTRGESTNNGSLPTDPIYNDLLIKVKKDYSMFSDLLSELAFF